MTRSLLHKAGLQSPWSVELLIAALCLLIGAVAMPALIYYVGVASLGRYEGASLGRLFETLYAGFTHGSIASWLVIVGPYLLYLLFRALRACWSAPA